MTTATKPSLFGLEHSNRVFSKADAWGKNQFNSSFPAALLCWMGIQNINPVYFQLDLVGQFVQSTISTKRLWGLPTLHPDLFFAFEDAFTPYSDLIVGSLPRADLVTRNRASEHKDALSAFEIKLTALPDSTTHHLTESLWGCEIVVRPDTIVYLALSIAQVYRTQRSRLQQLLATIPLSIENWSNAQEVQPHLPAIIGALEGIFLDSHLHQTPILIQPIFKTEGKKSVLAEQCFDCFIWSNFALARLFFAQSRQSKSSITRHERSSVWLYKMLLDFAIDGIVDAKTTIDSLTYNLKNDKAFASAGSITNGYMKSSQLLEPRVPKSALREIILGGGHLFLSPERRLDAIIVNTPGLFL
jgi:hypothetical protein